MGEGSLLHVPLVVGAGAVEVLVTTTVSFPDPVLELLELRKTVWIDSCGATLEHVLVQGRLHLCYIVAGGAPGTARPLLAVPALAGFAVHIPVAGAGTDCAAIPMDGHVTADASRISGLDAAGRIVTVTDQSLVRISVRVTRTGSVPLAEVGRPLGRPLPPATPPGGFTVSRFGGRRR